MASIKEAEQIYDRKSELKAFDETKPGVKGLVDSGITKVPPIFIQPVNDIKKHKISSQKFNFPIIDMNFRGILGPNTEKRKEIVDKIREASEKWGFFHVVNHGIPINLLEEMIEGTRRFYEQDNEIKKKWYTRDFTKRLVYNSNFDLYSAPADNWRDSFYCSMAPNPPNAEDSPESCRYIFYLFLKLTFLYIFAMFFETARRYLSILKFF